MITIERTEYAFTTLNASPEEWKAIKTIVRFCAQHYWQTELLYSISGPEENRQEKVESLSEILDEVWGQPPFEQVYKDHILLIAQCITHTEGKTLPDVDDKIHEDLAKQFYDLGVYDIFDDDNVTDEQWDTWNREQRIHDTSAWMIKLHAKQTDKAGNPYAQHPLRVHMRLQEMFPDAGEDIRHAALLHDVMEDCGITSEDLRKRNYSENTIQIIEAVTKNPDDGLTYAQRIENLVENGPLGAIQIKLCDLLDNNNSERLKILPKETAVSLSKRYTKAIEVLKARLNQ